MIDRQITPYRAGEPRTLARVNEPVEAVNALLRRRPMVVQPLAPLLPAVEHFLGVIDESPCSAQPLPQGCAYAVRRLAASGYGVPPDLEEEALPGAEACVVATNLSELAEATRRVVPGTVVHVFGIVGRDDPPRTHYVFAHAPGAGQSVASPGDPAPGPLIDKLEPYGPTTITLSGDGRRVRIGHGPPGAPVQSQLVVTGLSVADKDECSDPWSISYTLANIQLDAHGHATIGPAEGGEL